MLHEYHVIYSVRYYPRFHGTAIGHTCNSKFTHQMAGVNDTGLHAAGGNVTWSITGKMLLLSECEGRALVVPGCLYCVGHGPWSVPDRVGLCLGDKT
jgi:hypothetical protein